MVIEAFPDAWLEDPDVTDETKPLLDAGGGPDHLGRPDPLGGGRARPPWRPKMVNIKPSRFGPLSNLFEMYDWCEAEGVRATAAARPSSVRAAATSSTSHRYSTRTPRTTWRHRATTSRSSRTGSPRARSSRASRRRASAGSSDRAPPAPSWRQPPWTWRSGSRRSSARRASRSTWRSTTSACRASRATWWRTPCATRPSAACACGSPTTPSTPSTCSSRRRRRRARSCSRRMPFPTCGIPGIPDLMHHKYVVRDGESVWTGSMNWTTDSWTLQENVVVVVAAGARAGRGVHRRTSRSCGRRRNVDASGHQDPRRLELDGRDVRAWFTPGHGEELSHRIGAGDRPGARARADRLAGDHRGRRCSARSRSAPPSGGWTCAAWWTARRWTAWSTSGGRTGTRRGRSRSSRRCSSNADFKGKPSTQ